jgi:proteasome lid subunit RPN8/RPN11
MRDNSRDGCDIVARFMLEISDEHHALLTRHAERAYPHECCGFLLGRELWRVGAVLPATNAKGQEERHNRFIITPDASMRAEKEARRLGLSVIGHYHSHPDHPARPSAGFPESDLSNATWPGIAFVIVSVMGGRAAQVTCWNLSEDRSKFEPVEIRISRNHEGQDGTKDAKTM